MFLSCGESRFKRKTQKQKGDSLGKGGKWLEGAGETVMGVNMVKVPYTYVRKCHNETHCFIQLMHANNKVRHTLTTCLFDTLGLRNILYK